MLIDRCDPPQHWPPYCTACPECAFSKVYRVFFEESSKSFLALFPTGLSSTALPCCDLISNNFNLWKFFGHNVLWSFLMSELTCSISKVINLSDQWAQALQFLGALIEISWSHLTFKQQSSQIYHSAGTPLLLLSTLVY